ncbi:hypothetical protein PXK01_07740 [Phaeobacter sp. PT47_59]|uniref:hypothetical protein n=1 Tax=Phaeobacter sp. PT47_59 TaxID=3029979 RepID=UPI002380BE2B|nr:hypothetical protein [Phaeobacter sp. PT47_59]MDE4174041.1 hypothetical protein [Phaeobacter sp. PT47_59]
MITKFAKPILPLTCCALLAACGGTPASNEMRLDSDGNGRFSGTAGAGWTPEEIRTQVSAQICGNAPVAEFRVTVLATAPDYTIISGRCASGTGSLSTVGVGQNHVATAPATAVTTPVANNATWDGSTPFVD